MPIEYSCSSCSNNFSIGSYHGVEDKWFDRLYCRNCGAAVWMSESAEQFISTFGAETEGITCTYELAGPVTPKLIVLGPGMDVPVVECSCGAKGPFGSHGPITDEDPGQQCPRCKKPTLEAVCEWIT